MKVYNTITSLNKIIYKLLNIYKLFYPFGIEIANYIQNFNDYNVVMIILTIVQPQFIII